MVEYSIGTILLYDNKLTTLSGHLFNKTMHLIVAIPNIAKMYSMTHATLLIKPPHALWCPCLVSPMQTLLKDNISVLV